jgi:hypothetical protein
VSFAAITLSVASQRVFIVVVYFVMDSVRKHLDMPSRARVCVYHFVLCEHGNNPSGCTKGEEFVDKLSDY